MRTAIAAAIDRIRDHFSIAKDAVRDDDWPKVEAAIEAAIAEVETLRRELAA